MRFLKNLWKKLFWYDNPLRRYPLEKHCFCGSHKKAGKCCKPFVAKRVPKKLAVHLNEYWPLIITGKLKLPPPEIKRHEVKA